MMAALVHNLPSFPSRNLSGVFFGMLIGRLESSGIYGFCKGCLSFPLTPTSDLFCFSQMSSTSTVSVFSTWMRRHHPTEALVTQSYFSSGVEFPEVHKEHLSGVVDEAGQYLKNHSLLWPIQGQQPESSPLNLRGLPQM